MKVFNLLFCLLNLLIFSQKLQAQNLPPLSYLEEAALKHARLDPNQLKDWQKRSRWAAALPRLQVTWENSLSFSNSNSLEDNLSVTSAGVTIGPESNSIDQDWKDQDQFEIRAIWSFDELLFNRDELNVAREVRDQYFIRKRLLDEVQHHYFNLK
ncbi:MAG: hypothetical protein KDK66_06050, partial [Deltaproteobacteria bacterium]|nr:hypothetical protein [Deltaproteobacteria bacterium]